MTCNRSFWFVFPTIVFSKGCWFKKKKKHWFSAVSQSAGQVKKEIEEMLKANRAAAPRLQVFVD